MVGPSTKQLLMNARLEQDFWHKVRIDAASDPVLKEMLDQIKTYWILRYGGDDINENKKLP